jgi:multicomponent Na+:H+ antiporter subunit C
VTLAISVAVAAVFGAGVFLVQQRDLFRVVIGLILISNAAILFIIAAGLIRGKALTALVIGSSVAALLLSLAYRLYTFQGTVDLSDVSEAEVRDAEALEREDPTTEENPEEKPGDEEPEVNSQ